MSPIWDPDPSIFAKYGCPEALVTAKTGTCANFSETLFLEYFAAARACWTPMGVSTVGARVAVESSVKAEAAPRAERESSRAARESGGGRVIAMRGRTGMGEVRAGWRRG